MIREAFTEESRCGADSLENHRATAAGRVSTMRAGVFQVRAIVHSLCRALGVGFNVSELAPVPPSDFLN